MASFWLDWVNWPGLAFNLGVGPGGGWLGSVESLNGLDPDVPFGIPVLILGAVALLLIAVAHRARSKSGNGPLLLAVQAAGIAITVIAGANVLGMMVIGFFGSGPLVALAGGILLTSSVRET